MMSEHSKQPSQAAALGLGYNLTQHRDNLEPQQARPCVSQSEEVAGVILRIAIYVTVYEADALACCRA